MKNTLSKLVELFSSPGYKGFHIIHDDKLESASYLISQGVEIPVRCKDCYWRDAYGHKNCQYIGKIVEDDEFCKWGIDRNE